MAPTERPNISSYRPGRGSIRGAFYAVRRFFSKPLVHKVFVAVCVVALALGLSELLMAPLSLSMGSLFSIGDRRDFTVTDFFHQIKNGRPIRTLDSDIVVLNIDNCDRADVTDLISAAADYEPRVVALDVVFPEPKEGDEWLLDALRRCPKAVLATTLHIADGSSDDKLRFEPALQSYFADSLPDNVTVASVNFPTRMRRSTIRDFVVDFPMVTGDSIPSLVTAAVQAYDPKAADHLRRRGNFSEIIDFASREFTVLDPDEFYANPEIVRDKLVLVGAMTQHNDFHITPITDEMTGVLIHANAISTVLAGSYFTQLSRWQTLALAIALCFLLIFIYLLLPVAGRGITIRLLQVALLYLIIRTGYSLFVSHRVIYDISYTLLMITFGFFALDIWFGLEAIVRWLAKLIRHRKSPEAIY